MKLIASMALKNFGQQMNKDWKLESANLPNHVLLELRGLTKTKKFNHCMNAI